MHLSITSFVPFREPCEGSECRPPSTGHVSGACIDHETCASARLFSCFARVTEALTLYYPSVASCWAVQCWGLLGLGASVSALGAPVLVASHAMPNAPTEYKPKLCQCMLPLPSSPLGLLPLLPLPSSPLSPIPMFFAVLPLVFHLGLVGVRAQTYSVTWTPSNLPDKSQEGQAGTNKCSDTSNQTSECQTAWGECRVIPISRP